MAYKLLIINPGSTSTKVGVYQDEKQILEETIRHSSQEIMEYETVYDQFEFREELILQVLKDKGFDINELDAVVGRGGSMKPVESGTYTVNKAMLEDLRFRPQTEHASNLGAIISNKIAKSINIPAFIVDPVVVDELDEVARVSGLPEIERKTGFHALNQKAVAKRFAKETDKNYGDLNLLVAHMGGGVSVGAHKNGRIVDVNHGSQEGPFTPERAGDLPTEDLVKLCYSGKYTLEEIKKVLLGKGGIEAYLGTNDFREVEERALSGDVKAKSIFDAFIYQMGKEISKYAAVLCGDIDAIILTGGIAYSKSVTQGIKKMISFIAPVVVYPGEDELLALAQGGLRVLSGVEKAKEYK